MEREPSLERAHSLLGSLVRDVNTGFTGVAVAVAEFAYGCAHVAIEPEQLGKEGEHIKGQFFDEPRVELVEKRDLKVVVQHPRFKVGNIVEDALNHSRGFVSSVTTWLYGMPEMAIEPTDLKSDGGRNELFFVTESRAILIEDVPPKFVQVDIPDHEPKKEDPQPKKWRTGGPGDQIPSRSRCMP